MKHFLPAGQTSCFNEHYFASPAWTWYGIIVWHRFGSGTANNGSQFGCLIMFVAINGGKKKCLKAALNTDNKTTSEKCSLKMLKV